MQIGPRYEGEVIISIEGAEVDPLTPLVRQRRRLEALVESLSDAEWHAPSRCEAWTVQDVIAHLVGVNAFWHGSVRAGLAGRPTRMLAGFDPAATPALLVEPMRSLTPGAILEQFVASNDAFLGCLAELDAVGWATLAEAPPGHLPVHLVSDHALWDSWVHERDIALPQGAVPAVEPDEIATSLRYAAALSPAFAIITQASTPGCFAVDATDPDLQLVVEIGEVVAVRDGAVPAGAPCLRGPAVELLEALSIRAALPGSAPSEWHETRSGLAAVFATGA